MTLLKQFNLIFLFVYLRKYVIKEMKSTLKKGHLEAEFFTPDPQTYLACMGSRVGQKSTFVEESSGTEFFPLG